MVRVSIKKNISQSHKNKIILLLLLLLLLIIIIIIITGWCGLKSVEIEYKQTQVKAAVKLYSNKDPTLQLVWEFEEHTTIEGHQSLVKEAKCYAYEMGISLNHSHPQPMCKG